jgi:hypothetical protein
VTPVDSIFKTVAQPAVEVHLSNGAGAKPKSLKMLSDSRLIFTKWGWKQRHPDRMWEFSGDQRLA